MNLSDSLKSFSLSFGEFWAARNVRERNMLSIAALVAAFGLGYAVLIDPALAGRKRMNTSLPVLRQQVAQMQILANQAALLAGRPAQASVPMSKENINDALAHNGLKAQNVMLNGDFAKVQLSAVSFANMIYWLNDMQATTRYSVTETNIVALSQPDMVNATITLRRSGTD